MKNSFGAFVASTATKDDPVTDIERSAVRDVARQFPFARIETIREGGWGPLHVRALQDGREVHHAVVY